MWVLLIAFQFTTFQITVGSAEECHSLASVSMTHWAKTGQQAQAVCMRTWEI